MTDRLSVLRAVVLACLPALAIAVGAPVARADVVPADHRPPPPPQCPAGAQPAAVRGRGHGGWGGCAATTCTTDADCGPVGPCRETALCVGPEIHDDGPREPLEERISYRIAPLACDAEGACPSTYECQTAMRCIGRRAPPPPPPPSAPEPTSAPPSETESPRSESGCSVGGGRAPLPLALGLAALALAAHRRRRDG